MSSELATASAHPPSFRPWIVSGGVVCVSEFVIAAASALRFFREVSGSQEPGPAMLEVAARAIRRVEQVGASEPDAVEILASVTHQAARLLAQAFWNADDVGDPEFTFDDPPGFVPIPTQGGILFHDWAAAEILGRLGGAGAKYAEQLRQKARERIGAFASVRFRFSAENAALFAFWRAEDGHCPALDRLAEAVWSDVVRPYLKQHQAPAPPPPQLSRAVVEVLAEVTSRGVRAAGSSIVSRSGDELATRAGAPAVSAEMIESVLATAPGVFGGSVTAHRLLYWEVSAVHRQHALGISDWRTLTVDGGFSAIAGEAIGGKRNNRLAEQVALLLRAQAYWVWRLPHGTGNLITLRETPEARGRPARVTITVGEALAPFYVRNVLEKQGSGIRDARQLVPMLPPPPMAGRPRDWPAECSLFLRVLVEMRRRASELREHGGVLIDATRIGELGTASGLTTRGAVRALDRWTQGDGPLELVETARYNLSPHEAGARLLLESSADLGPRRAALEARKAKRRG